MSVTSTPGKFRIVKNKSISSENDDLLPLPLRSNEKVRSSNYELYLREIARTKLLSREEEIELADQIKKGNKSARDKMIEANLRLVVKFARDYEGYGLPMLDLINEGNIGLVKAVERFDPSKGAKLSTYAQWWIKQRIKRALANQLRTIRLPVHQVDKLSRIRRAEEKLAEMFGRDATDEELAEELEFTVEQVSRLRTAAIRPISLDICIGDDENSSLADVISDKDAQSPYEETEDKFSFELIAEVMKILDPREVKILGLRFGSNGRDPMTLEEVGKEFGVSRERIRQVQKIALEKIRKKIRSLETFQQFKKAA